MRNPPWAATYPWSRPLHALEETRALVGLDLWAIPDGWKMPYRPSWRPSSPSVPLSSPRLASLLVACGLLALGWLIWTMRLVFRSEGG